MKAQLVHLARRYSTALRAHLKGASPSTLQRAQTLGREALAAGLQTLDMVRLHEQTLLMEVLPGCSASKRIMLIKEAGIFFARTATPFEKAERGSGQGVAVLNEIVEALSQRTVELAASNLELSLEITHRKAAEEALQRSERHYAQLLEQSEGLQEQLRQLSRQILSTQEDERKRISRELHDVIAQTLTGINLRLATLKKEAAHNTKGLERNIDRTQRLVEESVNLVHQFARELRPAVLDDLGLIPALHSFMKTFTAQTGVRTHLTAFAGVEQLDTGRRTVFFRVAQEALTNVARHAKASRVDVKIQKVAEGICMTIKDDGKSFHVEQAHRGRSAKRLGLLGMKERLEMVGGNFNIESAPGTGTTVRAQIPTAIHRGRLTKKSESL